MAKVKIVLYRSKTLADKSHPVMLVITVNGRRKYASLNRMIHGQYWDDKRQNVNEAYPSGYRNGDELYKKSTISDYIEKRKSAAVNILTKYEISGKTFGFDAFMKEFQQKLKGDETFFSYFESRITELKKHNRVGYADVHKYALSAFKRFRNGKDLTFPDLTSSMIDDFIHYHENNGVKGNSISVYLRTIRTLVKSAIEDNYLTENPISNEKIKELEDDPDKRAINVEDMKKIYFLDLSENNRLQFAKDIFMFSFFAQGMAFADIALLKYTDIKSGNVIRYNRKKLRHSRGLKTVKVPLNSDALDILQKYKTKDPLKTDYIFPILERGKHVSEQQIMDRIRKKRRQVNIDLKDIGEMLELDVELSTYVARHSYASNLVKRGASVLLVMDTMGHSNLATTQKYIKSLDLDDVRDATDDMLSIRIDDDKTRNISIKAEKRKAQ
jgi:site-specific recombinase XerD